MKPSVKAKQLGALLLAGVLLCATLAGCKKAVPTAAAMQSNPYITEQGKPMVSAHRSGAGIYPENTLMAFESCVAEQNFKTDIFEFDLHLTKDNVLVLLHDENFDRTSNAAEAFGTEDVTPSDKTFEELQVLNLGENYTDKDGKTPYKGLRGEEIPANLHVVKAETVLDFLISQNKGYHYIIEIKNKDELGYQAADALHALLKEKGILDKTVVGTFNGEVSAYLDEHYPDITRSAGIKEVVDFYFSSLTGVKHKAEYFKFKVLQIPYKQYVLNLGTQRLIDYAHSYGIAVQYWTINDKDQMKTLVENGADAIITDTPDVAYQVIHGE